MPSLEHEFEAPLGCYQSSADAEAMNIEKARLASRLDEGLSDGVRVYLKHRQIIKITVTKKVQIFTYTGLFHSLLLQFLPRSVVIRVS